MMPEPIVLLLNALLVAGGSRVPPPVPIPPDPIDPPKVVPGQPMRMPADPILPPIVPKVVLPSPTPLTPIAPAAPVKIAVSLEDFAKTFVPAPGTYEITFLHPGSKRPVDVAFTLPDIPLKKFEVHRRSIEFHYPNREVEINFRLGGKVDVRYED